MKKSHSLSRSVRPSILVLVLFGLLAVLPWTGSIASAAAPATCEVDSSANSASYSSLQAAINAASPGNTLEVKGICTGTSTVTKSLSIKGVTKTSILDAGGAGSTLSVPSSVSATINHLTIQNGASLLNSHFVTGGADVPWVNVGGAQLPPTSGTANYVFVGRACNGDTLSANPSGKVALIRRGTCFFSDKAANAAAAGATAAVIVNNQTGAFPQANRLVNPVTIPVVGISGAAGAAMGASGTLTWTNWNLNGFFAQGCGGGGICNSGTLALVDSVVTGNSGTAGGGVLSRGTLTLAGSTSFSSNRGTLAGGIGHPAGTVNAADGTSTYMDPISGATLPAWTGSFTDNFIHNCFPAISLASFTCN
jgi:PA domain-containing protein